MKSMIGNDIGIGIGDDILVMIDVDGDDNDKVLFVMYDI